MALSVARGLTLGCLLLLTVLATMRLAAQELPARVFGQEDGLENQAILSLAQDPRGFLWIGTDNGLFRYDGAHFRQFGRADGIALPRIFNLFLSSDGDLFAASETALYALDQNRFREIHLDGRSIVVSVGSRFTVLPSAEILVASNAGLLTLQRDRKSGSWTAQTFSTAHPSFHFDRGIYGIAVDREGNLVFGCDRSLCTFEVSANSSSRHSPAGVVQLPNVPPSRYLSVFRDTKGRFYARSLQRILSWRPGDSAPKEISRTLDPGALDTYASTLLEDPFGNILTPTEQGFASWDGHSWIQTTRTSRGIIGGGTCLLADREGNVWLGTAGKGLIEALGYGYWENYAAFDGLSSTVVYGLTVDRAGNTWIGTSHGADILAPHASIFTPSPLAHLPGATWINSLAPTPDGGMWAANRQGLLYHVDARGRVDHRASVNGSIIRIRLDRHNVLWTAGPGGLFSVTCPARPGDCQSHRFNAFLDPLDFPEDMEFDPQGTLWIVSGSGLSALQNGAITHIRIPHVDSGFGLIAVAPDHTVWVAGQIRGMLHVQIVGDNAYVLEAYTAPELASDYIEFLGIGQHGTLWAGTDHGVNVIEDDKVSLLSDQDGLVWNDSDWQAFLPLQDGSVWIGTSGGVSHLRNPSAALQRRPFASSVVDPSYDQVKGFGSGASIPWSGGTFVVHFSGLTFRDNRTLLYHYKLDGFDGKTIDTSFPFARVQQLPPGRYTFSVVAEDPGHHTFSSPATLAFTLTPLWWQTGVFHGLLLLTALALIALIWRWSHQALLTQRERLQLIVAERTSELQRVAITDTLTGLLNRGAIMATLAEETLHARRLGIPLCVALVDLDHFKRVNDTLGHQAGDEVLRQAARRIQQSVRSSDAVGRYGGEEFLVIFRDVDYQVGYQRCRALCESLSEVPILYQEHILHVTASIGFACTGETDGSQEQLIAAADNALYKAKANGRNCIEFGRLEPSLALA
jgi:diguanylate cyclase (GGDEF)-like protein